MNIHSQILEEYERYGFKPLNYQVDYIVNGILTYYTYNFFTLWKDYYNYSGGPYSPSEEYSIWQTPEFERSDIFKKYISPLFSEQELKGFKPELQFLNSKKREKNTEHLTYIINLDVGL